MVKVEKIFGDRKKVSEPLHWTVTLKNICAIKIIFKSCQIAISLDLYLLNHLCPKM